MLFCPSQPSFGRNVRYWRKKHRMTQQGLAGLLNFPRVEIYNWEHKQDILPFDIEIIFKLKKIFRVPAEIFLNSDGIDADK